ncbi:MAG: hypothetical protein ABFD18_06175 [Syntrophomonas sp.]
MVECKFKVDEISQNSYNPEAKQVTLNGVQSAPFGQYTPSANCKMSILNPEAAKEFELGAEYKVTFEKIKG